MSGRASSVVRASKLMAMRVCGCGGGEGMRRESTRRAEWEGEVARGEGQRQSTGRWCSETCRRSARCARSCRARSSVRASASHLGAEGRGGRGCCLSSLGSSLQSSRHSRRVAWCSEGSWRRRCHCRGVGQQSVRFESSGSSRGSACRSPGRACDAGPYQEKYDGLATRSYMSCWTGSEESGRGAKR